MNKNEIWKSYRFPLILLGGIFLGALIGVIWGKQAAVTAILVGAAHSAHISVKVNSHIRSLLLPFVSAARRMPQYLNPVSAGPWR